MKSTTIRSLFLIFLFSSLILSCSNSVDSLNTDILKIETRNSAVLFTNNSDERIHYVLVEAKTAARIYLSPNYAEWPSIEAGSSTRISYEDIMGYEDSSTEAWITWRTVKKKAGKDQYITLK